MDFTLDELRVIRDSLIASGANGTLLELIVTEVEKLEEFEGMDFNDCGDACKL